jgi:ammonia channel protein AmtB
VGGVVGAACTVVVVAGALRRGGTRGGLALLVAAAAAALAALALVPAAGFLEALALPVLAIRLRRTQAERYAGLRTLAKD